MSEGQSIQVPDFEPDTLWDKVKRVAKLAGREVILRALMLYYCLIDDETPPWAKATIIGALIYFISPIDAVPDVIPGAGYADDLTILVGALMAVAAHIKPEHRRRAEEWCDATFGPAEGAS